MLGEGIFAAQPPRGTWSDTDVFVSKSDDIL